MRKAICMYSLVCAFVFAFLMPHNAQAVEPLTGEFTVNDAGLKVQFAPGNLQYMPGKDTWRFAPSQTDYADVNEAYFNDNPGYSEVIDLFPWGADYGACIGEGWRMLTDEEWQYLLREEELGSGPENAGQATIGTQHGLMLVPDGWVEFATLTFEPSANNWTTNVYTTDNWTELEKSGVVFLPCAEEMGMYWSATPNGQSNAYCMYFTTGSIAANTPDERIKSFSIRLVKEVKGEPTGVEEMTNDGVRMTDKVLHDGQMLIVRDGKRYTVTGTEVR